MFPPTLPSPTVENRRPTSFGTSFPTAGMQPNYHSPSPSQSPFGGFGFNGGWGGSGVWAPNSSTPSGSGGTSPAGNHGLQVKGIGYKLSAQLFLGSFGWPSAGYD